MDKLGRYQIIEEVGRGAMGVVYRAQDPIIGRDVAIKAINKEFLATVDSGAQEYLERFRREAQVAGGMNHPNIVKVFDLGDDFIVMELVRGRTLAALIESGRLGQAAALRVIDAVADALSYAHGLGITHRDVKPANVMIQDDGTVKVMDFGLARIESSRLTAAGAVLGSAAYMAPEVILGRPADPRSDVFSLGVLAYEALTGKRPFTGKTISVIMTSIVREPPNPVTAAAEAGPLDQVFARALAKEPTQRFTAAVELAAALRAAAQGVALRPEPAGGPTAGEASVVVVDADELRGGSASEETMVLADVPPADRSEGGPAGVGEATTRIVKGDDGASTLALAESPLLAGRPAAVARPETPSTKGTDDGASTLAFAKSPLLGDSGPAPPAEREATPQAPAGDATAAYGPLAPLVDQAPEPVAIAATTPPPGRRSRVPLAVAGLVVLALVGGLGLAGVIGWRLFAGRAATTGEPAPPVGTPTPDEAQAQDIVPGETGTPEPTAAPETRRPEPTSPPRPWATPRTAPRPTQTAPPPTAPVEKVTPPRRLSGRSPDLPRGTPLPASVRVEFLVREDGTVADARVVESGGEALDAACLEAVRGWRFQPAKRGSVAVPFRQQHGFTFRER
jgi:TonB family protein